MLKAALVVMGVKILPRSLGAESLAMKTKYPTIKVVLLIGRQRTSQVGMVEMLQLL